MTARATGGHYASGFDPGYDLETRDAWDVRSTLRAARYLRDAHGRVYRDASHNHDVAIVLSYVSAE